MNIRANLLRKTLIFSIVLTIMPDFVVDFTGVKAAPVFVSNYGFTTSYVQLDNTVLLGRSGEAQAVDLNNDGRLDLLSGGWNSSDELVVYLQAADGSFSLHQEVTAPSNGGTYGLTYGDIDNDGDIDAVSAGPNSDNFYYENTGDASNPNFITGVPVGTLDATYFYGTAATTADIDGDGKLDIIWAGTSEYVIAYGWWDNANGADSIVKVAVSGGGSSTEDIVVADIDGDGDLDFVIPRAQNSDTTAGALNVYINGGGRSFNEVTIDGSNAGAPFNSGTIEVNPLWLAVDDINGDGDLDIAFFNRSSNLDKIIIGLRTSVDGATPTYSFSSIDEAIYSASTTVDFSNRADIADVNNDGNLDLVVGGYYTNTDVLLGDGTGSFTADAALYGGEAPFFSDINADGAIDVVMWNQSSGLRIYYQDNMYAVSVAELQTSAIDVDANDSNGDPITYSLSGDDVALFSVVSDSGVITFDSAPDFELPTDSNSDNIYQLTVTATANGDTKTKDVFITVTDIDETDTDGDGTIDINDSDDDNDGVSDVQEGIDGTNSKNLFDFVDSDGDLVSDAQETTDGTLTNDASSFSDTDNDGIPNSIEPHVCIFEDFNGSGSLDSSWNVVSGSNYTPTIVTQGSEKRVRLTTASGGQLSGIGKAFPIPTNKFLRIDFVSAAHGGSGADGSSVILSDYSVSPEMGPSGGSLGYAAYGANDGFSGGWLGIGIDEYGNFSAANVGGDGGSGPGALADSVTIRGSGSNTTGYAYITRSADLSPGIDGNSSGYGYRFMFDPSSGSEAYISVDRDTGAGYSNIIANTDTLASSGQAALPASFQLSFAASTGGSHHNHDIGQLRVLSPGCASLFNTVSVSNERASLGATTVDFEVSLSEPAGVNSISLNYSTVGGTAVAGSEFTTTTGSLTFASGEQTKTISIPINVLADDAGKEFYLQLNNLTGTDVNSSVFMGNANGVALLDAPDTDGDGVPDYQEGLDGSDPNDSSSYLDTDADGVPDMYEGAPYSGGDVNTADAIDTDGDGISDYVEAYPGSNDIPEWLAEPYQLTAEDAQYGAGNVTATDADGETISYSVNGGLDAGLFNLDSATGLVTFKSAVNHSSPTDSDTDGTYEVTIEATSNGDTISTNVEIQSVESKVLDNDLIRFGTGSEASVNNLGNLKQPFFYHNTGSRWYQLTHGVKPLDIAIAVDGDGTDDWNRNGTTAENPTLGNQYIDTTNFTITTGNKGYGIIVSTGTINVGGKILKLETSYNLRQNKSFVEITTKVTNLSGGDVDNLRVWVGTRDDYVGSDDSPTKDRGNIVDGAFEQLSVKTDQSSAIKISSGNSDNSVAFFYSTSEKANISVSNCCSFSNAYNTNPDNTNITINGDGSYSLYMRMDDLADNASEEFTWFYAAGEAADIEGIIQDVASAAAVTKETNEDTTLTFASTDFLDSDDNIISKIKITSLPDSAKGRLQVSDVDVVLDQEILAADYSNLTYIPVVDVHGLDTFLWQGFINDAYGSDTTLQVDILSVNDEPTLTGTPYISGTAIVTQTLTVLDTGTSDLDGDTVTLSYQWQSNDSNIGVNSASYTVQPSDSGNTLTVVIIAADGNGGTDSYTTAGVTASDGVDTDGDGTPDLIETNNGTDPNDRRDYQDTDGDGVPDYLDNNGAIDDDSGNGIINYFIDYPLPFICDGDYFISQKKTLYRLDTTVIPFGFNDVSGNALNNYTGNIVINAIGFNYQDGYIYGMKGGSNILVRLEASGHFREMGVITDLPSKGYYRGDFDLEGNYYVVDGKKLYTIDPDALTAVMTKLSGGFGSPDVAYNVRDGKMYGANKNRLYSLDLSNNKVVSKVVQNLPSATYGAAWFDSAGRLFFSSNQTGDIYRIDDFNTPVANYVSKGKPTGGNDGTSCAGSPLLRHTILPSSTTPATTVTHTYLLDNGLLSGDALGDPLLVGFDDTLSDGRTFINGTLSINGVANSPVINAYGGTNTIDIDGLELDPISSVTITVDVSIPDGLGGVYYNQAKLTDVEKYLGGPEKLSDNPGGAKPDATPLVVRGISTDNNYVGSVYNDLNKNGTRDVSEPGVAGVPVALDNGGGSVMSDINGNYHFDALTDNNYIATMTLPEGYTQIGPNPLASVALSGGNTASGNDFAIYAKASIAGIVFNDLDGDKRIGSSEGVIDNVTVELFNSSGDSLGTTSTNSAGEFEFSNLDGGLYWIEETDDAAYTSISPNMVSINLASGQQIEHFFADIQKGTISGMVFDDLNGNRTLDGGEDPLAGVSVEWDDGTTTGTTTSDDDGIYSFAVVANKSYTVTETDPAGYSSITSNTVNVNVASGGAATVSFADIKQWTISGTVFEDTNGNNTQDEFELGLEGITITLSNGDSESTNASGMYQFTGVAAGVFSVTSTVPTGYATTDDINKLVSVPTGGAATASFAMIQTGTVAGMVFNDLDGDTVQSESENGVSGVMLELAGNYVFTGSDGSYSFYQIPAGAYTINMTTPAGFASTTSNSQVFNLSGSDGANVAFGIRPDGVINGFAFNDSNGNGDQDEGEVGISGVVITLDGGGSATTNVDGSFVYTFLNSGSKVIAAASPTEYVATTSLSQSLTPTNTVLFGFQKTGTVSGVVIYDENANGVIDLDEKGIAGAVVTLTDSSSGTVQVTTVNDGSYLFNQVTADDYTLSSQDAQGYSSVSTNSQSFTFNVGDTYSYTFFDTILFAPVAANDSYSVVEGGTLDTNAGNGVLTNDADANSNETLISILVNTTTEGSLSLNSDGSFIYVHNGGEVVSDSFTYRANDGNENSTIATVTFTITPVNDPAVIDGDDNGDTGEDGVVLITGTVTVSDVDSDNSFVAQTDTVGDYGLFSLTIGGGWSYSLSNSDIRVQSLTEGETVTDSFTISSSDGTTQTVVITITGQNDMPIANDDTATVTEDSTNNVLSVMSNDTDVDGDDISLVSAVADVGNVTINNGNLLFTPPHDFNGTATITYIITDGSAQDQGEVDVTVNPVNDAPIAKNDTAITEMNLPISLNVLGNDTDIEGDTLSISAASSDTGQVSITADTLTYVPAQDFIGTATIYYSISDGQLSSNATVEVIVNPEPTPETNGVPVVVDDVVTVTNWEPVIIAALLNDSDPDGDTINLAYATASIGSVSIENGTLVYTPIEGQISDALITYTIIDSQGAVASGTATVQFNISDEIVQLHPEINIPDDLCGQNSVNAIGMFTRVDIGIASAMDRFGNEIPVSLVEDDTLFAPGVNIIHWQATDAEGNKVIESQRVCVNPLITVQRDQITVEGEQTSINIYMNGEAPGYPVIIPYSISGTAEASDHDLVTGEVIINSGLSAQVDVSILNDSLDENDESIIMTLDPSINLGANHIHTLWISDGNLAPEITLIVAQNNDQRMTVTRADGLVTITAEVYDPNIGDTFTFDWNSDVLVSDSQQSNLFTFDPTSLDVGVYLLTLTVTDSGIGNLTDTASVYITVVDDLPVLDSDDSDGDGIPDILEGFNDDDNDGLPDYLDGTNNCNVLSEESQVQDKFIMEVDSGVCLRRGGYALTGGTGGSFITTEDFTTDFGLLPDSLAFNVGGIFDFIAFNIPENNQSVAVVIPQRNPVPANAVYRKYLAGQWVNFIEDQENSLWSSQGEPGYCPPPRNADWQQGLVEGSWCVQLILEDGGVNDDDMVQNGTIVDPGFVGVLDTNNTMPIADDIIITIDVNATSVVDVTNYISDGDNDPLKLISATAEFGTVTIQGNNVTYVPMTNYDGNDVIRYVVTDGRGGTAQADIAIDFFANSAPVAGNLTPDSIRQGTDSDPLDVVSVATDIDNDVITLVSAQALNGQVTIVNNQLVYIPNADFHGTDTITYVIQDSYGHQAIGTLSVLVRQYIEVDAVTKSGGGSMDMILLMLVAIALIRRFDKARYIAVVFTLLWTANLAAQCEHENEQCDEYWYVGLSLGNSATNIDQRGIDAAFAAAGIDAQSQSVEDSDLGYSLMVGYLFQPNLSVELDYLYLGERVVKFSGNAESLATLYDGAEHIYPDTGKGFRLSIKGFFPIAEDINITGKIGFFNWTRDYDTYEGNIEVGNDDIDGFDITYGIGIEYQVNKDITAGIGFENVSLINHNINTISLGITYRL